MKWLDEVAARVAPEILKGERNVGRMHGVPSAAEDAAFQAYELAEALAAVACKRYGCSFEETAGALLPRPCCERCGREKNC